MLTKEIKDVIIDYFEAYDLVDFLKISTDDLIEAFEELIEDNLEEVLEEVGYVRT